MADPFRDRVDAEPEDWNLRLVYADWLDEQGRPMEAAGQRWQARRKKRPLTWEEYRDHQNHSPGFRFVWGNNRKLRGGMWAKSFPHAILPWYVFRKMESTDRWCANECWAYYRAAHEAEGQLAAVLAAHEQKRSSRRSITRDQG